MLARRLLPAALMVSLAACAQAAAPAPTAGTGVRSQPTSLTAATANPDAGQAAGWSVLATARVSRVTVRSTASPSGAARATLVNPTADGGPLTFRVLDRSGPWLLVQLPIRPNASTGWIPQDDVTLGGTPYRLLVRLSRHTLSVYTADRLTARYPVGVGTPTNPTPTGSYYLTELISVQPPDGAYGPYAFGISAFSPTLTSFAGGPGQVGLHGTDRPALVGTDVSHGCLRVTNDVIRKLAAELPLGTPVEIRR